MPEETEVRGLLSLLLLQDARKDARLSSDGSLILLEDQDRSRWEHDAIREGVSILESALRAGRPGAYQLQAAIAAEHSSSCSRFL